MLDTEHGLWPSLLNRQIPGSSPRHRNTNFRGYAWESVGTTGPSLGQSLPVTILGLLGHRPTSNICSLSSNGSPPARFFLLFPPAAFLLQESLCVQDSGFMSKLPDTPFPTLNSFLVHLSVLEVHIPTTHSPLGGQTQGFQIPEPRE